MIILNWEQNVWNIMYSCKAVFNYHEVEHIVNDEVSKCRRFNKNGDFYNQERKCQIYSPWHKCTDVVLLGHLF